MRNLVFAFFGVFLMLCGCNNTPEIVYTTTMSYFTPYQVYPEYLNGQIVSVEEMNYLANMVDGEIVKGELMNKEMRDSLKWSQNFTAYFNENGEMTHIDRYYDENDVRTWRLKYRDNLVVYAEFIRDDTTRYYVDPIEYTELGFITSSKYYNAKDNELINSSIYTTNDKGFWTGGSNFNAEGEKLNYYTLDLNDKNLTEVYKLYNANDSLLSEARCTYNDKGFYTKAVYMRGDGEIRRTNDIEYTRYDEMGNWLESVIYDNGELMCICERKYVYY